MSTKPVSPGQSSAPIPETMDERLKRLAQATAALSPTAGFEARVEARLDARRARAPRTRSVASHALAVSAVAAAIALWASYSYSDAVLDLASSTEVDWWAP